MLNRSITDMNTTKAIRWIFACLSLGLAAVVGSCADDRESFRLSENHQKEVSFSVQMPAVENPFTYALNATQEDQVETIEILLFSGGNYTGSPIYCNSSDITTGANSRIKTFKVKIPEGSYDVVVLANSRPAINAVHAAIDADPNKSKSNVLSRIRQSVTGKWNATFGSGGYVSIPMWGEIAGLTVGSSVPPDQTVNLLRMLAKIDVSVALAAQSKFKLRSVHLYNYNSQGYVAPQVSGWTTTPSPVTASRTLGPLNYLAMTTADKACVGEIYTFEAAAGSSANHLTNTCLVVGGIYTGDTNPTYYRIDFNQTNGSTISYSPLLRNYSYTVTIADVEGSGLSSIDDAFKSRTVKIQAEIMPWNNGDMSDVVSDGQHKLGVSKGEFIFTREARTPTSTDNILSITTDVSGGWEVVKTVDATSAAAVSWVRLVPDKGNTGTTVTRLNVEPNTGATRQAKIHINAGGRLTYVVTVTQTDATALMLSITNASSSDITDLLFVSKVNDTPAAQSIQLSWMPIDKAVTVTTAAVEGNSAFDYSSGSAKPGIGVENSYTHPAGSKTLSIQPGGFTPDANDPFGERISKVDFLVNNGVGGNISKSIFLRQMVYNFVVEQTANYYRLDGSTYTLRVKSNVGWKISSIDESTGLNTILDLAITDNLRTTTSGGANTSPGTDIKFRVVNNSSRKAILKLKFVSTDNPIRFNEKTLNLPFGESYPLPHDGWAGSNIYWDGSKLTFDDVGDHTHQNYQGVFFQWGSLWGIDPSGNRDSPWTNSHKVYRTNGGSYTEVANINWTSISRVDNTSITSNPPAGKTERDRAYLYELSEEASGKGDICKFLTKMGYAPGGAGTKWRMPTSNEFEASSSYSRSGVWQYITSTDRTGKHQNSGAPGYTKSATGNPFLPASGRRDGDGILSFFGYNGLYWSGSPINTQGYSIYFGSGSFGLLFNNPRVYSNSVRCVKEQAQ